VQQAAETFTLDQALAQLPETEAWVRKVLRRLEPFLPDGRLTVLEIGCSQGRGLVALEELGHDAVGVEPYRPALDVAAELAAAQGVEIEALQGAAESIPCDSERFDLVLAFSVLEHVDDLDRSLSEIHRVLKPGGALWFNSASSMCPVQSEITHLPLFGWYPDRLKRRIMLWARDNRPAWVGYTSAPAMHWWTPWKARRVLGRAGFGEIRDRWELLRPEELAGLRAEAVRLVRGSRLLRLGGDVLVPGCSYAAIKPRRENRARLGLLPGRGADGGGAR
jgi:SAM-dependent methyltransferase